MATTRVAATPMKAAQVPAAGSGFQIVEREIPTPAPGMCASSAGACGVCHSDLLTKESGLSGIQYPCVPGHQVVGVIDEVGSGRVRVDEGAARRGRLAWRPGRHLSRVQEGRFL